jgi:hypothetical protein
MVMLYRKGLQMAINLQPANPPKMGVGRRAEVISREDLKAWVDALRDKSANPQGVTTGEQFTQITARNRALKLRKQLTEEAGLLEGGEKIRTRVYAPDAEEGSKVDPKSKQFVFALQLVEDK